MRRRVQLELDRLVTVARGQCGALRWSERRAVGQVVVQLDDEHELVLHGTLRRRRRIGVAS